MSSRDYFLGKRIAVIGVGPHGEMMADVKFLVKANALVSVYDLKSESKLAGHMPTLHTVGLANQVYGSVPAEDLLDMDLIILSHEYPRSSSFLEGARNKGVAIEYPETLFLKLAPPVSVIGVMGAAGKSTVISMLAPLMEAACAKEGNQHSFVIDPESEDGTLVHLKKVKSGDVVTMRIVPMMMGEISALKWSPHVAVFTNAPSGVAYMKSPFEILAHQTYNNYVIGNDHMIDTVRASGFHSKAKMIRTKPTIVPPEWLPALRSPHDREDASLALEVARLFKVGDETAEALFSTWKPLKGRVEFVKKVRGVDFINDSASTTPISTIANMSVLAKNKNLILIFGGADHGGDYRSLYVAMAQYAHTVIVVPGSGTMKERRALDKLENVAVLSVPSTEEAVRVAMDNAKKGDIVLFSPAFPATGIDNSIRERGERFVRTVRSL